MDKKLNDYGYDCEYCVICGQPIPEGEQVCINCRLLYLEENE